MSGARRYSRPRRRDSKELFELSSHNRSIRLEEEKSDSEEDRQQSNDGSRTLTERRKDPDGRVSKRTRRVLVGIQGIIGVLLFVIVLVCSVLSKLSLLSITDHLRQLTWDITPRNGSGPGFTSRSKAAGLFWQLLLIMVLPNCVTFVRSLVFGVFGKKKESFPWPSRWALVGGVALAILEVFTINIFVFLVLSYLSPNISILIPSGVVLVQICIDIRRVPWRPEPATRHHYQNLDMDSPIKPSKLSLRLAVAKECFRQLLENRVVKIIALALQAVGILALAIFLGVMKQDIDNGGSVAISKILRPVIAFPIALLILSFIWSDKVQKLIAHTNRKAGECHTARYKSSFINSGVRVLLYPFVSYIVFRYFTSHGIDPWCIDGDQCHIIFNWSGRSLAVFLVQIFATFFAYCFAWIACTMTLHWLGMALPLLLSTPITIVWYYLSYYAIGTRRTQWFPFYDNKAQFAKDHFNSIFLYAPLIAMLLWFGQVLAMGYYIWTRSNLILSKDTEMFLTPHYDGVFFEQQLILNRQTDKDDNAQQVYRPRNIVQRGPRTIFICSTMYRENDVEMKQMLMSICRVAQLHNRSDDQYESHIFFDGSLNGTQLTHFALQLVSLLEETLGVKLTACDREETPYGCKLSWYIGLGEGGKMGMPFSVHMKDNLLVKNKKRWSQIMYMSYVLKYRIEQEKLDPENTFILTTDADIDFTADSAVVLLDMLASNPKVGAVCARTHPKGSGPLYWYQIFDYAIGHWFLKPAEHILGCVLCCPGCFSVFRCKALMETLEEYSSEVSGASEFLTKDMGEDRWLCTLLIERGWRLEYCAISEDYTYCPESFDEFFKQRRRWVPSTLANLMLLISQAGSITRGNDTVSILFILFQTIMVFSTAISPATVILIITSGLGSAYHIPDGGQITIIVVMVLVSVGYGLICIYTSQKTQLDIAKFLTFIFAIVMAVVFAGIFKSTIDDIVPSRKLTLLSPASCPPDQYRNRSQEYEECLREAGFLASQQNATGGPFELPVSLNTIYTAAFGVTFVLAALLHLPEWSCLLHFIWYLLALPAGYLLLLIYSAANVNSMSWGTREKTKGEDLGGYGLFVCFLKEVWVRLMACFNFCCCVKNKGGEGDPEKPRPPPEKPPTPAQNQPSAKQGAEGYEKPQQEAEVQPSATAREHTVPILETAEADDPVRHPPMEAEAIQWLQSLDCEDYVPNFEKHGYKNMHFIASMTNEDFEAIGIDKRGLRLRLEKAVKWLPSPPMEVSTVRGIDELLTRLELQEYEELFSKEGYGREDDIENLKSLQEKELREMGVHKRAHIQRFLKAFDVLFPLRAEPYDPVQHPPIEDAAKRWLQTQGCKCYVPNFEKHGYKNIHFIASMTYEDFEAIGIDKRGLRLRLVKEAKKLPSLPIETMVPRDVDDWLKRHELQEYKDLFSKEGYSTGDDIENLKDLKEKDLRAMGIHKRAHLRRLLQALDRLFYPKRIELQIRKTKGIIEGVERHQLRDANEAEFWKLLINKKLMPVKVQLTQIEDLKQQLKSLRNTVLAILLLVNLMWIILLYTLTFPRLADYDLPVRAFSLVFLGVYGIIVIVQFLTLIVHRVVTLVHYLGRISPEEIITQVEEEENDFVDVSFLQRDTETA